MVAYIKRKGQERSSQKFMEINEKLDAPIFGTLKAELSFHFKVSL